MPTVSEDTHRGAVVGVLSTDEWMDCHDVVDALSSEWTVSGASSVLSDINRAEYVERQEVDGSNPDGAYEYKLKGHVRIE